LREKALRARRGLGVENRATASTIICDRVTSTREFQSAANIACYIPMSDEVDTRPIIARAWRANKRVFVPVMRNSGEMFFREIRTDTTLQRNRMSIWEPDTGDIVAPRLLQLVITPTVAFDRDCNRIGMGGGYYDRTFSFLKQNSGDSSPKLVGIAFECQRVERITPNPWDIRLLSVFTEAD